MEQTTSPYDPRVNPFSDLEASEPAEPGSVPPDQKNTLVIRCSKWANEFLKSIQDNDESNKTLTRTNEDLRRRVTELESRVADLEGKNKNLQSHLVQMAQNQNKEIQDLQDIIRTFFAFNCKVVKDVKAGSEEIRLSSVKSGGGQDDEFIFEKLPNKKYRDRSTPAMHRFSNEKDIYLTKMRSIPDFLAAITKSYRKENERKTKSPSGTSQQSSKSAQRTTAESQRRTEMPKSCQNQLQSPLYSTDNVNSSKDSRKSNTENVNEVVILSDESDSEWNM